ncbi:MAG: glycosyltransferase [Bacteroidota bacterium]
MNVVYLGCNGFPYGFAQVQKQMMISKALLAQGAHVTVINYKGVHSKQKGINLKYKGMMDGVKYYYSSFTPFRSENFISRNLSKLLGNILEFCFIVYSRKTNHKNIAIITTNNLSRLRYYYYVLKILKFKVVLSYEEYWQSTTQNEQIKPELINFDLLANTYCDAILPISVFLANYQKGINNKLPSFRLPSLTDFDIIDAIQIKEAKQQRLLFCGASAYVETITFILESFEKIQKNELELFLIIHGDANQNKIVSDMVDKMKEKNKKIKIFTELPFDELIKYYKTSQLLLIPLKPLERDIARFPHKISEYVASKTAIVTNSVGEINSFFINHKNAFIANGYDVASYANEIEFALNNQILMEQVAENAYLLGRANFHYKAISEGLISFLSRI